MEILEQRFGKPQQIISAHMEELLKLPNCSQTKHSTSLRFVYDKVSVHVRGLSALGVNSDQYGGLLIPVIMPKLLEEIRVRVARETTSAVWKIEELLEIIKQEVEALGKWVKAWKWMKNELQGPQGTNADTRNLQRQVHWFQRKIPQGNHIKSDVFTAMICTILVRVRRSQLQMIEEVYLSNWNVVLNV